MIVLHKWLPSLIDCFTLYGGGKGDSPPTPDYTASAIATAQGNLQAARAATAANRVNQITPYGNMSYSQTGQDQYGNPTYTATQSMSQPEQQLFNQNNNLSTGMLNAAQGGLPQLNQSMANPGVNLNGLPSVGINPGQNYAQAMMAQQAPQIQQQRDSTAAQLANQGITQGSQAYNNAMSNLNNSINNLYAQDTTQGFNAGLNANQNAFSQQAYNTMAPINMINAARTGNQVQSPNYVNPYSQSTTSGADLTGAAQNTYNSNLASMNAQNAASGNFTNGLFSLGAAAMMGGF